jgi:hypothetical protein
VRRVRISVVALVPPVRGVRATLSASGVSRTVAAHGPFSTVTLHREPETVAFTGPIGATGRFDLEPETGQLLPFEGMGVDANWRLELPKAANPFDFRGIADVLLTLEYTAFDSETYRQQVLRTLDRRFTGDRAFSLRNDFPDAWYALAERGSGELRAPFTLRSDDFPSHVEDLRVAELTLFFLRADDLVEEVTVVGLSRSAGGQTVIGGEVRTTNGTIGTRRPAGAPWRVLLDQEPVGDWELRFGADRALREWFREQLIQDVVLVVTLAGTTPARP